MNRKQLIGTYDRKILVAEDIQLVAHLIIAEHIERVTYSVVSPEPGKTQYFDRLDAAIEFYNQSAEVLENA